MSWQNFDSGKTFDSEPWIYKLIMDKNVAEFWVKNNIEEVKIKYNLYIDKMMEIS